MGVRRMKRGLPSALVCTATTKADLLAGPRPPWMRACALAAQVRIIDLHAPVQAARHGASRSSIVCRSLCLRSQAVL